MPDKSADIPSFSRREFLKKAGASAIIAAGVTVVGAGVLALEKRASDSREQAESPELKLLGEFDDVYKKIDNGKMPDFKNSSNEERKFTTDDTIYVLFLSSDGRRSISSFKNHEQTIYDIYADSVKRTTHDFKEPPVVIQIPPPLHHQNLEVVSSTSYLSPEEIDVLTKKLQEDYKQKKTQEVLQTPPVPVLPTTKPSPLKA